MTGKTDLLDELRARKAAEDQGQVDWTQRKSEWTEDLDKLMATIEGWLRAGVDEGLMEIHLQSVRLREENLGAYDAPSLRISVAGGKHLVVEPVGTLIIGAAGRVDMSCGPQRATILRMQDRTWKFHVGESGDSADFVDATEDTFTRALRELIA